MFGSKQRRSPLALVAVAAVVLSAAFADVRTDSRAAAAGPPPPDFTPRRHCDDGIPTLAQHFKGSDSALASTIAGLADGATLVIEPDPTDGVYEIDTELVISGKQNVTICGAPGTRPKIKQLANAWRIFTVTNSSNIVIEGLEIFSINDSAHDRVTGVQAIEGADHVSVWDVWAHDLPACGICSARSNGYNDFRYNRIWTTAYYSRYQQSGISLYSNRPRDPKASGLDVDEYGYSDYVIGNMVWDSRNTFSRSSDGNCIILDNNNGDKRTPAYKGRFLVANNLCVANYGRGIHVLRSDNADIVNNTLYHDLRGAAPRGTSIDQHQGELSIPNSSHLRLINNLSIAIPYGNVFDAGAMGSDVVLAGNLFNGPTSRQPPAGGWSMISDPGLAGPTESPVVTDVRDDSVLFRPASGSYVIEKGTPSYEDAGGRSVLIPTVDFTGKPRGTSPSVGAFEP
jgi:hypothetical protein